MDRREEGRVTNKRVFLSFFFFLLLITEVILLFHLLICLCVCGFCIYLGVCENVQMGPAFVFYQEKKKDELDYFLVER